MGATASTYTQTVHKLTPDGQGGFWWVAKDSNDRAYKISYDDSIVESTSQMFFRNTFLQLLNAMNTAGVSLPQVEVNINIDKVSDRHSLASQFTSLTNAQINSIAQVYDPVNLCKLFGAFPLVRKFFVNGHLTLAQLSDVLLYLGERNKVSRTKVENVTNTLLTNGNITQAQYDAFWTQWATRVGGV